MTINEYQEIDMQEIAEKFNGINNIELWEKIIRNGD